MGDSSSKNLSRDWGGNLRNGSFATVCVLNIDLLKDRKIIVGDETGVTVKY